MTAAGCTGKLAYANRAEAADALRSFIKRGNSRGDLHAYHCGVCGSFHLVRDKRKSNHDRIRVKPHFTKSERRLSDIYKALTRGQKRAPDAV